MASYELDCSVCGGPGTAARKDAKTCHPCAVLKVLTYLRSRYKRPRECVTCARKYRPASQQDRSLCGACDGQRRPPEPLREDAEACLFCRATVPRYALHRKVCQCCMKDPTRQTEIVALLSKQQATRIETYGHLRADAPNIRKVA